MTRLKGHGQGPESLIFQCALAQIPLAAALQLLASERIGVRVFITGSEANGWFEVARGEVWNAECEALGGDEAMLELLLNEQGIAEAFVQKELGERGVQGNLMSLLMDSLRLKDHWLEIAPRTLVGPPPTESMPAFERTLANGYGLAQVVGMIKIPRIHAIKGVDALLKTGEWRRGPRVQERPSPDVTALNRDLEGPEPRSAGDYFEAMDRGLEARRRGDLEQARRAWERALSLRPEDRVASFNLRRLDRLAQQGRPL